MTAFPSLKSAKLISLDCETCDPDLKTKGPGYHRKGNFIAGVAVSTDNGFSGYYPIAHEGGGNLPRRTVLNWLDDQLKGQQPKLFAHAAYDLGFLGAAGVRVNGPIYDIQVAEPLLDENRQSYSLESLAQIYLKRGKKTGAMNQWIMEKFKCKEKHAGNFIWRTPVSIVAPYAIEDTQLPLAIFAEQKKALEAQNLWELFLMECRLIPMLVAMRNRGVRVDLKYAEELFDRMTKEQSKLSKKIYNAPPWNARAIAKVFDKAGIQYPRTPKTDAPSFTKEWLAACPHPIAQLVHRIRHLDKLRETFIKNVVLEGHYKGRIHASFNQLRSDNFGTISGRFSSSDPNLQQIPIRTDLGKAIRQIFIADAGCDFGATDFSQIEFRLLTLTAYENDIRGAKPLTDAYLKDRETDFHAVVAEMTGLPRLYAKTITFAAAYGAGPNKIAMQLGLPLNEGLKILDTYHSRAPFIRPLSQHFDALARRNGEIRTLLGRVRRFHMWARGMNDIVKSAKRVPNAERLYTYRALNAYIQGSAADILKQAMVLLWENGVCDVLGAPHLTVHDELDISVPKSKIGREAFKEMVHTMETAVELSIPLLVDHGLGKNWGDAKGD